MAKRNKTTDLIRGTQIQDMEYNEQAGAKKVLGPILGDLTPLGATATEQRCEAGMTFAFFNADTAIHYIKFGVPGLSAPSSPANGLPLPPGAYTVLAAGNNTAYRSDSANVYAYQVNDDSVIR